MSGNTPTTPQHFIDGGAIPQPPDGPNAKTDGQKCLTCIRHGGSCHGTTVLNGRCDYCRGLGAPPKPGEQRKAGNKRACYWLNRANNIHTYRDGQRILQGRTLPVNSKAEKEKRRLSGAGPDTKVKETASDDKKQKSSKPAAAKKSGEEEEEDAPEDQPAIFELPTDSREYRILQRLAVDLVEGRSGWHVSDDPHLNLRAIMTLAEEHAARAWERDTAENARRAQEYLDYLTAIFQTMRTGRRGLSRREIRNFLPDDHPSNNLRRPG